MTVLIIDNREQRAWRERVLEMIPDATVDRLAASDYLLFDQDGHSIGIERKEITDLLRSMTERKMKRQLESLSQFDQGILVIEGHWTVRDGNLHVGSKRPGWRPQSVQAILLSLQEQTGVKVLHTANYEETILVLRMLNNRAEKGCFWKESDARNIA